MPRWLLLPRPWKWKPSPSKPNAPINVSKETADPGGLLFSAGNVTEKLREQGGREVTDYALPLFYMKIYLAENIRRCVQKSSEKMRKTNEKMDVFSKIVLDEQIT